MDGQLTAIKEMTDQRETVSVEMRDGGGDGDACEEGEQGDGDVGRVLSGLFRESQYNGPRDWLGGHYLGVHSPLGRTDGVLTVGS